MIRDSIAMDEVRGDIVTSRGVEATRTEWLWTGNWRSTTGTEIARCLALDREEAILLGRAHHELVGMDTSVAARDPVCSTEVTSMEEVTRRQSGRVGEAVALDSIGGHLTRRYTDIVACEACRSDELPDTSDIVGKLSIGRCRLKVAEAGHTQIIGDLAGMPGSNLGGIGRLQKLEIATPSCDS